MMVSIWLKINKPLSPHTMTRSWNTAAQHGTSCAANQVIFVASAPENGLQLEYKRLQIRARAGLFS